MKNTSITIVKEKHNEGIWEIVRGDIYQSIITLSCIEMRKLPNWNMRGISMDNDREGENCDV